MKLEFTKAGMFRFAAVAGGTLLVATIVVGTENETRHVIEAVPPIPAKNNHPVKTTDGSPGNGDLDLASLNRPTVTAIEDRLFSPRTSARPASAVAPSSVLPSVVEPPPKPTAPPLAFKYLGQLVDRGVTTIFVAHTNRNLSLKEGDVVENTYRVEHVREGEITFTYLPLQEQQVLPIGRRN